MKERNISIGLQTLDDLDILDYSLVFGLLAPSLKMVDCISAS